MGLSGPDRDRTDYLLDAIEALYQVSYGPKNMSVSAPREDHFGSSEMDSLEPRSFEKLSQPISRLSFDDALGDRRTKRS